MSLLIKAKGISKLSELEIDADKNWNLKGVFNVKEIAQSMGTGHIIQHDGEKLVKLPPGPANYVLTSEGTEHLITWAPGGAYLWRYFPVAIELSHSVEVFAPAKQWRRNAFLASPYGVPAAINPGWFNKLAPTIALARRSAIFTPDRSSSRNVAVTRYAGLQSPIGGAVIDDGGVQADETPKAKSGPARYEYYDTDDDGYQGVSPTIWQAQTFSPASAHKIRSVKLKLYRSGYSYPGLVRVSIRATDAEGHPAGNDIVSGTIDGNYLTTDTNGYWYRIPFDTAADLSSGRKYALIVRSTSGGLYWRCDATAPIYPGGNREYSTNSGESWVTDTSRDFMFEEWGTINDMTLLPAAPEADDAYYFGHYKSFNKLWLDIGQAGAGNYTLDWEYWNGTAWAALPGLSDNTNNFMTPYTNSVAFTLPADWATTTVAGITNLYWIRARVSSYVPNGYIQPLGTWAKVEVIF